MAGNDCVQGHKAAIFDRGGTRRYGPLRNLSLVDWPRLRDQTTEARVQILGKNCDEQADFIASIQPHRHELVIWRGKKRVWEGPVHRAKTVKGFGEIVAHDVSEYLFRTPMTQRYNNSTVGGVPNTDTVTGRIEDIILYELANGRTQFAADTPENAAVKPILEAQGYVFTPVTGGWDVQMLAWEELDPPINVLPHLRVHHYPNEAETSADTDPFNLTVGMHLQSLARTSGIDYTVIGRAIHIWDVSRSLGRIADLTDENFVEDPIVTLYGSDHTQAAYSVGQDGAYGSALALPGLDYYGPWTTLYTAYNEEGTDAPTQSELDSQAKRNVNGRQPVPMEIRVPDNSTMFVAPDDAASGVKVEHLIPGVQARIVANLGYRTVSQLQKIDSVRVVEEGGKAEQVRVTFTPATKPDSDVEEP